MTSCWHSISLYKSCIVHAEPGPKPNTSTISARALINSILLQALPEDPIVGEEDASDTLTEASQVLHARVVELADDILHPLLIYFRCHYRHSVPLSSDIDLDMSSLPGPGAPPLWLALCISPCSF
jgi:hypothetical protein